MKRMKSNAALFLLALYTIILIHGFIAHDCDSELFETFFRTSHIHPSGRANQTSISENGTHLNIFSADISLNIKKHLLFPDAITPDVFMFTPDLQEHTTILTMGYIQFRTAYYFSIFLLRSPPFA